MQDSAANPTGVTHLENMLTTVGQECTHLQAEFQKTYSLHAALASKAAWGATLPNDPATQPATQVLPTDRTDQMSNGPSRAAGPNLNPSAVVFQPTDGSLPDSAVATDLTGVPALVGTRLMTTQEYEAMLDPQYIADRQWECEEQQKKTDELLQMIE